MKNTLLLSVLIACTVSATAQNTRSKLANIVTSLNELNTQLPVEKVHLHVDKPYYSVGDTIWLKAYITGNNNRLSALSNVVHVELINDADSIITSQAMPVSGGQAWGAITLTDTSFSAGNYNLRAYTNVMRNYDNLHFYSRYLAIGNALPTVVKSAITNTLVDVKPLPLTDGTAKKPGSINLDFFPEGGNLLSNIMAKIAFKATGEDGLSRSVNGYIVDQNNNRVATFASEHAGMGTFNLFAQAGNTYTAVVTSTQQEERFTLPQAHNEGYTLSASQDKNNLLVKIISSATTLNTDTLNLIAQANNEVLYSGKAALNGQGLITTLDKKRFPNGILQLTLFNKDFVPVAERLVFIKHENFYLQLELAEADTKGAKGDALHFNFTPTDAAGKAVTGTFSMAVTDADKVAYDENNETSIFSNLLLTSDLKGYIEQPNYYFTDALAEKNKHLDNLLLTQGWRRFVWQDVLAKTYKPATFKPERAVVSGTVTDNKKLPVAGARVALFVKNGAIMVLDTVADANGKFTFANVLPDKGDDYKIIASNEKGRAKYNVQLDKPESISAPPIVRSPIFPYNGFEKYLESARLDYEELDNKGLLKISGELLGEVTINEKKELSAKDAALKHSANLHGAGYADKVVTFIDLLACNSATDLAGCLIGKLNGIRFKSYMGQTGLFPFMRGNTSPMAIFINGGYSANGYEGSLTEISAIEILRPAAAAIYGSLGVAGVMIITTKTGDIDYFAYEQAHLRQNNKPRQALSNLSFAPRREFYVPRYKVKEPLTDLKSTIYWKPDLITDGSAPETIAFLKGKAGANYRIVIEGVDVNGRLGRKVINYSIK